MNQQDFTYLAESIQQAGEIKKGLRKPERIFSFTPINLEANITEYINGDGKPGGINPFERYVSFDYCFNYFQSFRDRGVIEELVDDNSLQTSCLQLGFYLASWGMLRGSSFLLNKSVKFYEPVIKVIAECKPEFWQVDVDSYTSATIDLLLEGKQKISQALGIENNPTDTLLSKIMLGVFGSVPAFDTNFTRGFGGGGFNKKTLQRVANFYTDHKTIIDANQRTTIDFVKGEHTKRPYTKAKVIDMIFFIEGSKKNG